MVPANDSLPSSPDPLTVTTNPATNQPIGPNPTKRTTPKKPVAASSGNISLQNLCLATPPAVLTQDSCSARAIALTENPASPWRIHITVEAKKDPDGGHQKTSSLSPTRRMAERSTTTTIPLKGGNDSSPLLPKRGRGRPRKTLIVPTKRTGTPKPRRSTPKKAHRKREKDTPEHDILPNNISSKTKGRPRKSMRSEEELGDVERTETITSRLETNIPTTHRIGLEGTTPREIVRERRGVTSPANAAVKADSSAGTQNTQVSYSSPMNFTRALGSVDSEDASPEERMYGSSNSSSLLPRITGNLPDSPQQSVGSAKLAGWESQCSRQPKHLADDQGVVDIALDPTNENHEFDSIMECEDFTMISISTLPSAQQQPSHSQECPKEDQGTSSTCQQPKPNPDVAGSMREDNPEMHRSTKSSPKTHPRPRPRPTKFEDSSRTLNPPSPLFPYHRPENLDVMIRQKNPSQSRHLSSPALPIPSQLSRQGSSPERSLHQCSDISSRLARAMGRGIAVQDVLEVVDNHESSNFSVRTTQSSVTLDSPMQRLGDPNSGFGPGTKREPRAGLRPGEALGEEQRLTIHAAIEDYKTPSVGFRNVAVSKEASIFSTPEDAGPRMLTSQLVEQRVDYPMLPMKLPAKQFPIPEGNKRHEEEKMVNRNADLASESISYSRFSDEESTLTGQDNLEDTMLAREAQWQREREATSRQIQEANTSQIIVIESDDSGAEENITKNVEKKDDKDEEDMDVWQAEARYPLYGKSKNPVKVFGGLCAEVPQEPRRSKLPSPWQRHSKTIYGGQTVDLDDEHDLLWRPVLKHPRTPTESLMRKKAKYDDLTYSVLSDCIGQTDSNRAASVEHQARSSCVEVGMNVGTPEEVQEGSNGDEDAELCGPSPSATVAEPSQPAKTSKVESSALGRCVGQESVIRQSRVSAQRTCGPTSVPPSSWCNLLSNTVPYLHALIRGVGSAVADIKETFKEPSMIPDGVPVSEPLSIYLPWRTVHYRRLRTVYLDAKRDHQLYPFNPSSPARWLLGRDVESMGWKKQISEWEVGVVDVFMKILATEGVDNEQVALLRKLLKPIDAAEVAKRIFSLWCAEVQRGKAPLGKAVAGIFDKKYEWRRAAVLQEAAERGGP